MDAMYASGMQSRNRQSQFDGSLVLMFVMMALAGLFLVTQIG
jgi:hypothetical protein